MKLQAGDLLISFSKMPILIVDIDKSGLVVGILIKHIKVLWEGKEVKISKWLLNNKVFKQEYKHLPRVKNNTKKK